MAAASRLAPAFALTMFVAHPALAEEVMPPQEFCARLSVPNQAACLASAELLAAPPVDAALTVLLSANEGRLSVEYRVYGAEDRAAECTVNDAIALPSGEVIRLLLTSADVIYAFEVAGYVARVDLVPGRVNERLIKTPAEAGIAGGFLQADTDGSKKVMGLRFISDTRAFDPRTVCGG